MENSLKPLTPQTVETLKEAFVNPFTDRLRSQSVVFLTNALGQDLFQFLLDAKVFWNAGLVAHNMMETSVNNWQYVPAYYLNEDKLNALL